MRLIGIDPGGRNIGLAVCDALGLAARPLSTLTHVSRDADVSALIETTRAQEAEGFVIGLAIQADGTLAPQGVSAQKLADALREASGLPVWLHDEWGSSREGVRRMIESGKRRQARRDQQHAAAAAAILQSYLDATARETPSGE